MALLYRRTPAEMIQHLRMYIAKTLDRESFDEEFGIVLVQNVTDTEVYLGYNSFSTRRGRNRATNRSPPGPHNSLLVLMLQTPKHRYETFEALREQIEYNSELVQYIIDRTRDPHILLYEPFGEESGTLLELYLSTGRNAEYQHMLQWFVGVMEHHEVPFVRWKWPRREDSLQPLFGYGSALHLLIKNFEEKVNTNHPRGDFRILPIRKKNTMILFGAMSSRERRAVDHLGRTALELAQVMMMEHRHERPDLQEVIHAMGYTGTKRAE